MFDSDTSSSGNDSEIDLEKILMQNEKDKEHQNKMKSTESTAVSSILDKILTSFMDEKKLPMTFLTKPCLSEIENTRDSIIPPARQQIESQISTMDAKDTIKNDFLSIARLEIERIEYTMSMYERSRIQKINEYPYHFLLKDSEMFEAKQNLLTSAEYRFARSLAAAEEKYFTSSFLSNLPKQLSTFKKKALQIDESKAYVFIKVNTPQPDFVYEYNNDIIELPLKKGDKLMVKCKLIEDLLENNEVSLL